MSNDTPIILVTQTRIQPGQEHIFEQAITQMSTALRNYQGYLSQEIHRPNPPTQLDWVLVQNFVSADAAKTWLQSEERYTIFKAISSSLLGIDHVYIIEPDQRDRGTVTATITDTINPQREQSFVDWQLRIAPLQSKFPGFIGYKLERPRTGMQEAWVATVTFDTDAHLDSWLTSPERQKMLAELRTMSSGSRIEKIYSGFNFWFTQDKKTNRAAWKQNMLVLLALYPMVFLLSHYIQTPIMMKYGIPFWLALFFNNLVGTVILGYVTIPLLMTHFDWWLVTREESKGNHTVVGVLAVLLLYAISLCFCWWLS